MYYVYTLIQRRRCVAGGTTCHIMSHHVISYHVTSCLSVLTKKISFQTTGLRGQRAASAPGLHGQGSHRRSIICAAPAQKKLHVRRNARDLTSRPSPRIRMDFLLRLFGTAMSRKNIIPSLLLRRRRRCQLKSIVKHERYVYIRVVLLLWLLLVVVYV